MTIRVYFYTIALTLLFSSISVFQAHAQCVVTGSTPDGGDIVICSGTDTDGITTTEQEDDVTVRTGADLSRNAAFVPVIQTQSGDDNVLIEGGMIDGSSNTADGINMGPGSNVLHMIDGTIFAAGECIRSEGPGNADITVEDGFLDSSAGNEECIQTDIGNDKITVNGGEIIGRDAAIQTDEGQDMVIIKGGRVFQARDSDPTIRLGPDNDFCSVRNAVVDGTVAEFRQAIDGEEGDDRVELGTGAEILGIVSGGPDFDTLVFNMAVPDKFIDDICSRILAQSPAQGQVTILGLLYEWNEFEVLLCELGPDEPRPIPTLSEWGLIAMACVLGFIGLLAVRKKQTLNT